VRRLLQQHRKYPLPVPILSLPQTESGRNWPTLFLFLQLGTYCKERLIPSRRVVCHNMHALAKAASESFSKEYYNFVGCYCCVVQANLLFFLWVAFSAKFHIFSKFPIRWMCAFTRFASISFQRLILLRTERMRKISCLSVHVHVLI